MDKRQIRQSAVADFMQSLEHLDELLGDTSEAVVLDEAPQSSAESNRADTRSSKSSKSVSAVNTSQQTNSNQR